MRSFLQTLLHPDHEDPDSLERGEVAKAANILMVGEFQFLQLAYYEWFGRDMPTSIVDRLFGAYMFKNHVPHWARAFARRVIEKDERGFIDPHSPFFHRYDSDYVTHVPGGLKRFCRVAAFLVLFVIGTLLMANYAVMNRGQFQFPPYVDTTQKAPGQSVSIDGSPTKSFRN